MVKLRMVLVVLLVARKLLFRRLFLGWVAVGWRGGEGDLFLLKQARANIIRQINKG